MPNGGGKQASENMAAPWCPTSPPIMFIIEQSGAYPIEAGTSWGTSRSRIGAPALERRKENQHPPMCNGNKAYGVQRLLATKEGTPY